MSAERRKRSVAGDEVLSAAIVLREDDSDWDSRISAGVIGRVRRRRRRNMALAAALTFLLGGGLGLGVFYESQAWEAAEEDPYLTLYEGIYADSAAYPELEGE